MTSAAPLSRDELLELLEDLSQTLARSDERARMFVVGGAAMSLGYDQTRTTRDVDALFEPKPCVHSAVADVAARHGLDPDWLNDAAKGFMPGPDPDPRTVYESDHLLVQVASPEYLLAMKLHSARPGRDIDDAAILYRTAGYTSPEQALDLLEQRFPGRLLPRHQYLVHEIAAQAETDGDISR